MSKAKRISAGLLAAGILTCVATGCYGNTKTVVMASDVGFAPYEYIKEDGSLTGIDVEIGTYIAKASNATLKVVDTDKSEVFDKILNGECDIAISAISASSEVPEGVFVSEVYSSSRQVILVRKDAKFTSPFDLYGKNIGYVSNLVGQYCAEEIKDAVPMYYKSGSEAVRALTLEKIDAVVIDESLAEIYISENADIKRLSSLIHTDDYVIAVDADNAELVAIVTEITSPDTENKTVKKIQDRYIIAN